MLTLGRRGSLSFWAPLPKGNCGFALPVADKAKTEFPQRSKNARNSVSPQRFSGTARRRCPQSRLRGIPFSRGPSRAPAPTKKISLRPALGRKHCFRGTTHIRFQESHSRRDNGRRPPGIGRSSRANQAPLTQRASSRRPSFSVRPSRHYFPDHSRHRVSQFAQVFKSVFVLFAKN